MFKTIEDIKVEMLATEVAKLTAENAKLKSTVAGLHMDSSKRQLALALAENAVSRLTAEVELLKLSIRVTK